MERDERREVVWFPVRKNYAASSRATFALNAGMFWFSVNWTLGRL